MKCHVLQTYLLGVERPERPPADVRVHLAACPACRAWQRRLIQLEQNARLLPVPPSVAKAGLIHKVLSAPATVKLDERRGKNQDRGFRKLAVASSLAAALVMVTLGLWLWRHGAKSESTSTQASSRDSLVGTLLRRDVHLVAASTARKRVETLADLADDLHGAAWALGPAAADADLKELAQMYRQVVREGIITHAAKVPAAECPQVLSPIAERLAQNGSEATRLAQELSAESVGPVRDIAEAAHEGNLQLRDQLAAAEGVPTDPGQRKSASSSAERLRQLRRNQDLMPSLVQEFQRNRGLIQKLVQDSLRLAAEEDPVKRVRQCNGMAKVLVAEMRQAAENLEGTRVAELGQHLNLLLKYGVADNLNTIRDSSPDLLPDSSLAKKLEEVREETKKAVQPLEQFLYQRAVDTSDQEMQRAHDAVQSGRTEVEKTASSNKDKDKDKGKGKGHKPDAAGPPGKK